MKKLIACLLCCLTFFNFCYGSDTNKSGWSWPIATALGLRKASTAPVKNLPESKSSEWTHVDTDTLHAPDSKTPSPDVIYIGNDGEETRPISQLESHPKLNPTLQTEILIGAANLPMPPQKTSPRLESSSQKTSSQRSIASLFSQKSNSPTAVSSTSSTPKTPDNKSNHDCNIEKLAQATTTEQPNPMLEPSTTSYQNSETRVPLQIEGNSNSSTSPQIPMQTSLITSMVLDCCPCLHFWHNSPESKKKNNG